MGEQPPLHRNTFRQVINTRKIFIIENLPSLNKGEMTILDGMLKSFGFLGNVKVSMLSARPEIDTSRYSSKLKVISVSESWPLNGGLNCSRWGKILVSILVMLQHLLFIFSFQLFGRNVLRLFKSDIWKEYLIADVFIEGHNGTFGTGGSLGIPYLYLLYLPLFAKLLDKPIVFFGGSISQGKGIIWTFVRIAYRLALKNMNLVTLRERISYDNIKAIDLQEKYIFVTADPAFLLDPAPLDKIQHIMNQEGIKKSSQPLIGVTVTRRMASTAFPMLTNPSASYCKHIEILAKAFDNLINNLNAKIIFIPHCIGFGDELDDRLVANDIFLRCKNQQEIKLITKEYSAAELKGLIGQFDLFIGERLHSVVNAISMRVPSLVISNSTDQRLDIIRMFGQDNAICFADNLDHETLLDKINDIWSNRDKIKEELDVQIQSTQDKSMLNGKLLKETLDSKRAKKIRNS